MSAKKQRDELNENNLKKYQTIFVLVNVWAAASVLVFGANFFGIRSVANQAMQAQILIQQEILLERIAKDSVNLDWYVKLNQTAQQQDIAANLQQNAQLLDAQLKDKKQFSDSELRKSVAKIQTLWQPYFEVITQTVHTIDATSADALLQFSRENYQVLQAENQKAIKLAQEKIASSASMWSWFQAASIILVVILFVYTLIYALRPLVYQDQKMENAHTDLSDIIASVHEGLFLLNPDFTIGEQYSMRLEEMLGQRHLAGKDFLDIAATMLPENEVGNLQVFVEQLYNEWVLEELIEDLNPMHRVALMNQDDGTAKYLDFKFSRVLHDGKVQRVLVSVLDTTEAVMLQASIEAQEEQEKREMEMLNTIVHTDSTILANFIQMTKQRLGEINAVLKSPETGQVELKTKINYIGRSVHGIKGESSALRLARMVDICEIIEDTLSFLRKQNNLGGQDFLGLVVLIEDLHRLIDILDNYSDRLNNGTSSNHGADNATQVMQARIEHLQQFVNDIAEREGKHVKLNIQGFEQAEFSDKTWQKIQDILLQILRNSVVHGIESPIIRTQRHKPETGYLRIVLTNENGQFQLLAEDDGNGIDFDAIRKKAVSNNEYTQAQANTLSKNDLLALMMSDGFSTIDQATEDAGKGIGMGIVKDSIHQLHGRMNVNSSPEQYTRFTFTFPKQQ